MQASAIARRSPYPPAAMRLLSVTGTRPQFVKAAPLHAALAEARRPRRRRHRASTTTTSSRASSTRSSASASRDVRLDVGSGSHAEQTARDARRHRARASASSGPTRARLRRHELDARRRARRRQAAGCRSRTSRRACARSTCACPRRSTASSPTASRACSCARRRPRSRTSRAEGITRGRARRRRRDGRPRAPARARSRARAPAYPGGARARARRLRCSRPSTARRTPRSPRLGRIVEGLGSLDEPRRAAAAPAHARGARARRACSSALERARARAAAARLPATSPRSCARARRLPDRLGRRAEGGLPARRAVRDAARHDASGSRRSSSGWNVLVGRRSRRRSRAAARSSRRAAATHPERLRRRPRRRADRALLVTEPPGAPARLRRVNARIAVIGAGYVGLPLAVALRRGRRMPCSASSPTQVASTASTPATRTSRTCTSEKLGALVDRGLAARHRPTASEVADCDDVIVCVPTPLTREPRARPLVHHAPRRESIAPHLRAGHLVVLESTTYPGTTRDEHRARCSSAAPGSWRASTSTSRCRPSASTRAAPTSPSARCRRSSAASRRPAPSAPCALYAPAVDTLVPVSSPEAAELAKLLENIFRSVNIALVNEMAMLCDRHGRRRLGGRSTPPRRSRSASCASRPGPGLGGHCIPLDPFYLSWRRAQFDFHTEFIELAGKVNAEHAVLLPARRSRARSTGQAEAAARLARAASLGVAYKPDIDDTRESPALKLIELLRDEGADVSYHDPYVPQLPRARPRVGRARRRRDRARPTASSSSRTTRRSTTPTSSSARSSSSTSATRPARAGSAERQGRQAVTRRASASSASATGARTSCATWRASAELAWCCDLSEENRDRYAPQYPQARFTADFDDLLADAVARRDRDRDLGVPTHHPLGLRALAAGKHVFIEKPLAR